MAATVNPDPSKANRELAERSFRATMDGLDSEIRDLGFTEIQVHSRGTKTVYRFPIEQMADPGDGVEPTRAGR